MREIYNEAYYKEYDVGCGKVNYQDSVYTKDFLEKLADKIVQDLHPKMVLDAGCAMGHLVAALRDRGVEAYGVDISDYAISMVREDIRPYCFVGSLTEKLPKGMPERYDLVVTIEVLEHLYAEDGERAIQNLCQLADTVLFSSTPDDFTERTHVNVQQREYWAKLFAKNGFFDDVNYQPTYLTSYAICFRNHCSWERQLEDYERNFRQNKAFHEQTVLEWRGAVNDREAVIQELKAKIDEKETAFSTEKDKLCGALSQLKELQSEGEKTQEKLHQRIQEIQALLDEKEEEKQSLKKEAQSLGQRIQDLEKEYQNEQDAHADIAGQLVVCQDDKDKLQENVHDLENQLNACEMKVRTQADKMNDLQVKYEQKEEQLRTQESQINSLQTHLLQYQTDLQNVQNAYQEISNAFFWKITGPCRKAITWLKYPFRNNKTVMLAGKTVRCLHQNGIPYTVRKIKDYRAHIHQVGQTLTNAEEHCEERAAPETVKFSVIVPLYNTNEQYLREMIESVRNQTYSNWELCLADGSDAEHKIVETICREYHQIDSRILYKKLEENRGISENTNCCIEMATGDYLALLDHDDILMPNALKENAYAILETAADVLYSDEDHLSIYGEHKNPFFKPDWSPDLLYSQMYICHFLVFKRSLFQEIGGFRKQFDGAQDYDLMLRMSGKTERICHIPEILYSWRESENSTASSADAKPYAHMAGLRALDEFLKEKYGKDAYAEETEFTFVYNPRFAMSRKVLISIIIPMKDKWELSDQCIKSILEKTTYSNFEILILNNRSEEPQTYQWFEEIQNLDARIRVIPADFEFNWSKLNNFGIQNANGTVYVFLNNDTLVISADWLERLAENALRPDVGVVGGLLLYPDDTIQHAGVVVGIGGWADHIFKGMAAVHYGCPFVSPMVSRNVLAVTGACMAVSKETIAQIGLFDETFIICGSDVELGIRAYEAGLVNRYDAHVKLYHLESKSRDSYIPEVDFQKSYEAYTPYRENVDPYFNINLDSTSVIPKEKLADMNLVNFKNFLKRYPLVQTAYQKIKEQFMQPACYRIPEIEPIVPKESADQVDLRLNLLIPSMDKKHVFGGIATALKFFEALQKQADCPARIIILDAPFTKETSVAPAKYCLCEQEVQTEDMPFQIIPMADRAHKKLPVMKNDVFLATGWWTAYTIKEIIRWQKEHWSDQTFPLLYMIQDYEPGFYPWSSRYMMADSTYRLAIPTYAIINSGLLSDYFKEHGYTFQQAWSFEPTLNDSLKKYLPQLHTTVRKKKQILVYGRPSTDRNAFELLIYSLIRWVQKQENPQEWTVLSAGERHDDVELGDGVVLHALGKLSLEEYAQTLLDSYAGISLMVSPHPSYPPLEMAAFGLKTITNCYANKNLDAFSKNMVSLQAVSDETIAAALCEICNAYQGEGIIEAREDYINTEFGFDELAQNVVQTLRREMSDID